MAQDNILAVIDIGSAETKVFIVDLAPKLKIIGAFSGKTAGMRKGEIVNLSELKESVHAVIGVAERQAGVAGRIRNACLSVSSMSLGGFPVRGVTSVRSGIVRPEDKVNARDDAFSTCICRVSEGRHIVQRLHCRYSVENTEVDDPVGKHGQTLAYDMWVIDAEDSYLTELYQIPNRYGMAVKGLFAASLASAESVRSFSEMDRDRLVIDIGAGTSDYVLFRNNAVVLAGVIPVGGEHITNDISRGLQVRSEDAERLKLRFGNAYAMDSSVAAEIDLDSFEGELKEFSAHVSRYKMELVIETRLRELFYLIWKKVCAAGEFSGTVFLTGGTSKMQGIGRLASSVFGNAEVHPGETNQDFARGGYSDPKYATAVGLAKLYRDAVMREREQAGKASRIRRFFREIFK